MYPESDDRIGTLCIELVGDAYEIKHPAGVRVVH